MNITQIAKTYNILSKHINQTCAAIKGEQKIIYKVKNKFYFMNEKDNVFKCIAQLDSEFLETMDTLKENVIFSLVSSGFDTLEKVNNENNYFAMFDHLLMELDKATLLHNDFFSFCINDIDRENNIIDNNIIDNGMIEKHETEAETQKALSLLSDKNIITNFIESYFKPRFNYNPTMDDIKEMILLFKKPRKYLLDKCMPQNTNIQDYKKECKQSKIKETRVLKVITTKVRSPPLKKWD